MSQQELSSIASQPEGQRLALYRSFAEGVNTKGEDVKGAQALFEHLVEVEGATPHGRSSVSPAALKFTLDLFLGEQKEDQGFDIDDLVLVLNSAVGALRKKEEDYPDQLMQAVRGLAHAHEEFSGEKDYVEHAKQAAFAMGAYDFEKGSNAGYKVQVQWFVDTAEYYLDAGEPGSASQQLKTAAAILQYVTDAKTVCKFRLCYARVCDAERKFQDAAARFLQLAQSNSLEDPAHIIGCLKRAVLCAVLAPAGPKRARTLAMLYSDDRTHNFASFKMLDKMFKGRIIRHEELKQFSKLLQPHQKVEKGGQSLLQKACIEHNLLAASRVYKNISIEELGVLLGLSADKAEMIAWTMIESGRMKAVLDQVDGFVEFQHEASGTSTLYTWDSQIQELLNEVNRAAELIQESQEKSK